VISFRLSRPVGIVLVVKGPGPSCERVGRGRIAGRAGLNRVRFNGTVRNVPLKPGMYRLDTRLRAGGRLLGSSYVTIIDPRSPSKQYVRPDCSPAKLAPTARSTRAPVLGSRDIVALTESAAPVPPTASEPKPKPKAGGTQNAAVDELAQVLGERTRPEAGGVPINVTGGRESRSILEVELVVFGLLILFASVLYMSVRRGRSLF